MTTTQVHGITVALITEEQIGQAMDNIMADWPKGWHQDLKRYVKDTLHDCAVLAGHYEDAARLRATRNQCDGCARGLRINQSGNHIDADGRPVIGCTAHLYAGHAKAMHKLAASLICPPAADDEPERLRKAGAL